jgi:hypothetical protein
MIADDFSAYLAPFKLLTNKNALSATYRSLELDGNTIRGCSGFGTLEVSGNFGLPKEKMYVEAATFIAVIDSLPADKDVVLRMESASVLAWEGGTAKGRLALSQVTDMPRTLAAVQGSAGEKPTKAFLDALKLGALSCGNESLASVGMYGIVIDNTDDVCIYASDDTTISCAFLPDVRIHAPAKQTYSPDAVKLLCAIINPKDEAARLYFSEEGIYYSDAYITASVKQLAPLKADINAILAEFSTGDTRAPLPVDRLQAFIKRINAMSDGKRGNHITIQASNGRLTLSFSDGLAASEEYYMVDDLQVPDLPKIELDAAKVARALAHVDSVILDHIERRVLVFEGQDPLFQYIVSGKA